MEVSASEDGGGGKSGGLRADLGWSLGALETLLARGTLGAHEQDDELAH